MMPNPPKKMVPYKFSATCSVGGSSAADSARDARGADAARGRRGHDRGRDGSHAPAKDPQRGTKACIVERVPRPEAIGDYSEVSGATRIGLTQMSDHAEA